MAVVARKPGYADAVEIRDRKENFHGNQVVYLHWEEHLSFCAATAFPLPPEMPFGALTEKLIPQFYGMHPDFKSLDWNSVEWKIDGEPATPDMSKSLAENGVGHKSLVCFRTPGLNGYKGSCS
ncbi:MAG: phenol hydroxylase subunit P4 [Candidatus Thiodiazotropha sp. (ex Lucinoma annulata)]|nr:phenol hydroxylase subunit P4 [Candidatus Thiodiazotropha sp. (ex Lucinoma borealis)]MCU7838481.1 phenol hydroxylase subunit P4 [Candidatus Thiodiazotropha sp. (ex Troendleina suluensis)]MCU7882618.1 phenol hydroxylase subunit P4 [Candidatus Thiodiazotropha sp. (ex Lucinoma annulata)]MCU7946997.1 phenol hydroxylase subunit P4 [Candidatus Thiodiazotropha sp. (ex Cardiolucina cf. quadrata)]MCU7854920.1 phenol hydroxylase subunit P4 [Candidatus Thiodiazotropha sp. (ex Lucinoma borealis)]